MEKIASFTVNHLLLEPGIYVSRVDRDPATGCTVTTFDLRMTAPNREQVMDTAAVHAIEHLGATYLRNNDEWKDRVLYFGPMGCRTGFYLVVFSEATPFDVAGLVRGMFQFVADFEGEVPGATPRDCGNWHDSDPVVAAILARKYLDGTLSCLDEQHTVYPE